MLTRKRLDIQHSAHLQDEEMRRTQTSPTGYYLEISSIFTTDDIFVCGLAPCGSNIALLGTEKIDGRDNTSHMLFQLLEPHNKYCTQVILAILLLTRVPERKSFETSELDRYPRCGLFLQISSDRIPLKMSSKLRTDFTLSCLTSEQRLVPPQVPATIISRALDEFVTDDPSHFHRWFILSPSELVVARPADKDDYIDRLIANEVHHDAKSFINPSGPVPNDLLEWNHSKDGMQSSVVSAGACLGVFYRFLV